MAHDEASVCVNSTVNEKSAAELIELGVITSASPTAVTFAADGVTLDWVDVTLAAPFVIAVELILNVAVRVPVFVLV